MKKLVSIVLALALVLLCVGAAFADGSTITVVNENPRVSIEGKEYKAYKIFDAIYGEGTAVSYTIASDSYYYTNTTAKAALDVYFTFTPSANNADVIVVTQKEGVTFDARALADALTGVVPTTADGTGTGTAAQTATISVAGPGYYLVTGSIKSVADGNRSAESAVALVPVNTTAEVHPKADIPDLKKEITAASDGSLLDTAGKAAVAKVGSTVDFKLTSTVPDITGYSDYTYTFTDTMSSGLTYNDNAQVFINGSDTALTGVTYTKVGNGFTLTIPFSVLETLTAGQSVEVKYTATVNQNALTYDFEKNTAKLTYSDNPGNDHTSDTPEQETYVLDINVDLNKYAVDPTTGAKLPGAEFKLFKGTERSGEVFYKWDATDGKVTWVAEADADVFTTNDQGHLTQQIRGLDAGTYSLLETKAPAGYNLLASPVEITITATESTNDAGQKIVTYTSNPGTVTGGSISLGTQHEAQPVDTIDVLNQQGTELPSTGGIGTTIFYILGGLLVIGAAVILVARRKAQD